MFSPSHYVDDLVWARRLKKPTDLAVCLEDVFFFICTRHNQFNHGGDTLPKLCKLLDDDKKTNHYACWIEHFLPMVLYFILFSSLSIPSCLVLLCLLLSCAANFPPNANFTVNHTSLSTCQCRTKQFVRGATLINKISHMWLKS